MITAEFTKEYIFKFDQDQIKDILIEAIRINGHDIPDNAEITIMDDGDYHGIVKASGNRHVQDDEFQIELKFDHDDLETYLEEKEKLK